MTSARHPQLQEELLAAIAKSDPDALLRLRRLDEVVIADVVSAILDNIQRTINEFDGDSKLIDQNAFPERCRIASKLLREDPNRVTAPPALEDFIDILFIMSSVYLRRLSAPSADHQERLEECLIQTISDRGVQLALYKLYAPDLKQAQDYYERRSVTHWKHLDPASFSFYRLGTTSIILLCRYRPNSGMTPDQVILKLVAFPWMNIPSIARSTKQYARVYEGAERVVTKAEASTENWVLMPFVSGRTLREYVADRLAEGDQDSDRIALAGVVAAGLNSALLQLSKGSMADNRQHLDLSPNNVIVQETTGHCDFILIDLGINNLYSRQVGIADHDDAVYVAPEVKNRLQQSTSDLYSVGVILTEILSGQPPRDGRVPDSVYQISPELGRMLDDVLDERHERRLLLLPAEGNPLELWSKFSGDMFALASKEPITKKGLERQYARFSPSSRELKVAMNQLAVARKANHKLGLRASEKRYLAFFSAMAVGNWWTIFVLGHGFAPAEEVAKFVAGQFEWKMTYADAIVLSQGLVAAKYYQTVLARLTVLGTRPGLLGIAAEVGMRLMSFVALPTAVLTTRDPSTWPWSCAVGALAVAATNLLTWALAHRLLQRGRRQFSTIPSDSSMAGYSQWWWTMLLYSIVIFAIAIGLSTGRWHDQEAYVGGMVLISLGIHYCAKCVFAGPQVRGGLARALSVGERLHRLDMRDHAPYDDRA